MASPSPDRGEMSQDSAGSTLHPSVVTRRRAIASPGSAGDAQQHEALRRSIDPAARTGKQAYDALSASSVGLELGISVILGVLFGYWLDRQLGTEPWMMILFLVLGLVAGFRGVLRAVGRADRAAKVEAA